MSTILTAPSWDHMNVYDECASHFTRAKDRRDRLLAVRQHVETICADYEERASKPALHEVTRGPQPPATTDDHHDLYTQKFAAQRSPGRRYYDKVMASALPGERCPYCRHGRVTAVDHFLPKSAYPLLSIFPGNLVPVCADCNGEKSDWYPTDASTQIVHPYYSEPSPARWLRAALTARQSPLTVAFSVRFEVPSPEESRIRSHFERFALAKTYRTAAAGELAASKQILSSLYLKGGGSAVESHLRDCLESSRATELNGWRTALFEALSETAWFCDGGFKFIA